MNPQALAARRVRLLLSADLWTAMVAFLGARKHRIAFRCDGRQRQSTAQWQAPSDYGRGTNGLARITKQHAPDEV